ncbi:hypothetical protein ONZ45_g10572 [Pleurotus djamor]|nr:hypothetical protein ONZ45_g10572 [Pleurotus djamor]
MASFKPIIRASQQPPDQPQPENSKYRAQAKQLQELFPTWSFDVTGDVELAATRISEGHAEQWGSVTRKKDKKAPGSAKEAAHSSTRGGRGGRGGARGGLPGRGGASARGRGGPPRGAPNGHLGRSASPRVNSPAPPQPAAAAASHVSEPVPESDVKQNGGEISGNGWAETSSASANAWANATSESSPPQTNGTAQHHHNVIAPKPTKTPATSKMSWAQIAR